MANDVLLETRHLSKEFAGFLAVNDVSLRVRRGAIHALIGPNGAGKTTVFNLLTRFLAPTQGVILYQGEDSRHGEPEVGGSSPRRTSPATSCSWRATRPAA